MDKRHGRLPIGLTVFPGFGKKINFRVMYRRSWNEFENRDETTDSSKNNIDLMIEMLLA